MSLLANMPVLRTALDRMLTDTGTVTIPGSGEGPFNPETGQYDPPPPITLYEGKMLVRPMDGTGRRETVQGATYVRTRYEVTLPADTEVFRDQTLTLTASKYDPLLVGRPMTLVDVAMDSWQVSRRCIAERSG